MWGGRLASGRGSHNYCSPLFSVIGKTNRLQVLANYLTQRGEDYCTGRAILELGSGTGLVGLVAGKLGGKVWITDQASVDAF